MRVFTVQDLSVLHAVNNDGFYRTNHELSPHINDEDSSVDFVRAYSWIAEHLEAKISPPTGVKYPIWSYHLMNGSEQMEKVDAESSWYSNNDIVLELEIPDNEVFETDYDEFHSILNNAPSFPERYMIKYIAENCTHNNSQDDWCSDCFDDMWNDFETWAPEQLEENWENNVPDVSNSLYTQACFWEIRPEHIINISSAKEYIIGSD